jgi:hypothetical protein
MPETAPGPCSDAEDETGEADADADAGSSGNTPRREPPGRPSGDAPPRERRRLWSVRTAVAVLTAAGVVACAIVFIAGFGRGKTKGPSVPDLIETLKDEDPGMRYWAARSLGKFGGKAEDAVPALSEALTDPDDNVRMGAAYALAEIGAGASDAAPALGQALKDKDEGVRRAARYALNRVQPGK